jgi:hypothetical protein
MRKILSEILIFLLKGYQRVLSPLFPGSCRFNPTCSQYGIDAIIKYGPIKGGYLTVRRILSCHPWGRHGYDPVP